jgi:hypothetical protein
MIEPLCEAVAARLPMYRSCAGMIPWRRGAGR